MEFSHPKGTYDLIPFASDPKDRWRSSYLWHHVEKFIKDCCALYGVKEIRTPIFEKKELFCRSVGQDTDIVSKEMYEFQDRAGRDMVLRPEGTAAVSRAYVEEKLYISNPIQKLYYIGPMFRYERPQSGRYRQHIQFGAEFIGSNAAEVDVEAIDLLYTLYSNLGLKGLKVQINSVGDAKARSEFRQALKDYLAPFAQNLSADSQTRLEKNPLRILDSKDLNDQKILENAPALENYLSAECKEHFARVLFLLKQLNIPYIINPKLVRGLDYYHRTVFEITAGELGAQNSVAGGGRYDGLIKTLGGPDLPAVGFATGLERVIQTLIAQNAPIPNKPTTDLFLIGMGDIAKETCFLLMKELRTANISVEMDFSSKKIKDLFRMADQLGAKYTAVIGDNELLNKKIAIKDMASRTETTVPLDQVVHFFHKAQ
ncbi:MAG: histidine--tRNA ligase [Parachlamydiales bacterium]|nr:histidine--tRNA ligase [Parachlamydiales bacterium]